MDMVYDLAFTCLRHGMTEWNEKHRYIGSTDDPLSQKGKEQVSLFKHSTKFPESKLIFISDKLRTKETANILFPSKKQVVIPEIREINFGDWEGKRYDELKDDPLYQSWIEQPLCVTPPAGESYLEFAHRVSVGFKQIIEQSVSEKNREIIVITHGGVIREWLHRFSPTKKPFIECQGQIGMMYQLKGSLNELRRGERFTLYSEVPLMEKINGPKPF